MSALEPVVSVLLGVAAAPALLVTAYLGGLTALSREAPPPRPAAARTRFVVVVPAHDEEADIARTVASIVASAHPAGDLSVLVVADNCTDDTAARARAAGATVLERECSERRGKGHALSFGFAHVLARGDADAVVVVDADTVVSHNLLTAFAARLSAGEAALQARYGVDNADASWRTCLLSVALAAYHDVRSLGRERLGLSCGLRGNGMCFTTALLAAHPHVASSLVEDVEYGVELGLSGQRVAYVHEARVAGKMVSSSAASVSQRSRWEAGRLAMVSRYLGPLLRRAVGRASPMALDLAADLLVPPLATVAGVTGAALALSALLSIHAGHLVGGAIPWLVCSALLLFHVARAWRLSGTGARGVRALLHVPAYVLWKIRIRLGRGARSTEWVRTAREASPP